MNEHQQGLILSLARATIRAHLNGAELPPVPEMADAPTDFSGLFVTLRRGGRLRGCIGRFDPVDRLPMVVQAMAVAVLDDPRFRQVPVTAGELGDLVIEISVLSKMERTNDPLCLEPGVHGILIRRDCCSGCFLPQVAIDQGWNSEQFLSYCCAHKAGLPADAWRDPATEVYLFTSVCYKES